MKWSGGGHRAPHPGDWTQTICYHDPELGQMTQLTTSSASWAGEEDTPKGPRSCSEKGQLRRWGL